MAPSTRTRSGTPDGLSPRRAPRGVQRSSAPAAPCGQCHTDRRRPCGLAAAGGRGAVGPPSEAILLQAVGERREGGGSFETTVLMARSAAMLWPGSRAGMMAVHRPSTPFVRRPVSAGSGEESPTSAASSAESHTGLRCSLPTAPVGGRPNWRRRRPRTQRRRSRPSALPSRCLWPEASRP